MLAAESEPAQAKPGGHGARNFALTILATQLLWDGNESLDSHGSYDYQAHVHVSVDGADPLESREASEVNALTSSKKRPAQRRAGGRFCLWGNAGGAASERNHLAWVQPARARRT